MRIKDTEKVTSNNLKQGHTFSVELFDNRAYKAFEEMGYVVAQTEFKVTISDLGDYVTKEELYDTFFHDSYTFEKI